MKLLEKTRVGSKVKKKYDKPQTPCQRVMASPRISKDIIKWLTHEHDKLNPAELKRSITRLQNKLIRYASSKGKTKPGAKKNNTFRIDSFVMQRFTFE
jgi:uncharacterized protein (DUF4415 family)